MTVKFTDFSEYATGVRPADWSVTGGSHDAWTVEDAIGVTGGKVLHHTTGVARAILGWDLANDGETDFEVVARMKVAAHGSAAESGITVRDDGVGNLQFMTMSDRDNQIRGIWGSTSIGAQGGLTIDADTYYWVRFRVNGQDWKGKFWPGAASAEPAPWTWEASSASPEQTVGLAGVIVDWFKGMDVDVFGFATGGASAPAVDPTVWVQDPAPAGSWVQDAVPAGSWVQD